MKVKALDEGNCGTARPRGKEAGVKAASPRTETGCEAGGADEWAPHHEVRVSAPQVKPGGCAAKVTPLTTGSAARGARCASWTSGCAGACGSVTGSNGSRPAADAAAAGGRSARRAFGLTQPQGLLADEYEQYRAGRAHERVVGSTGDAGPARRSGSLITTPRRDGGAGSSGDGRAGVNPTEPPGTAASGRSPVRRLNPYAGWCGGRGLITHGYPIRRRCVHKTKLLSPQSRPAALTSRAKSMMNV